MTIAKHIYTILMIVSIAITATAGTGREGILTASSESGKIKLIVKTKDTDGPVIQALLVVGQDTTDLAGKYGIYSIADLPNHIYTLCFQNSDLPQDALGTGSLKIWAIPSSFVKTGSNDFNYRFKLRIGGTVLKEIVNMDGTYQWML